MYECKFQDETIDGLFEALQLLKTREEYYRFFEDVCTIAEIKAIAQRLEVAKMLDDDKIYQDIVSETGASTATISRVNKCLKYGADGYKLVLKRLKEKESAQGAEDEAL